MSRADLAERIGFASAVTLAAIVVYLTGFFVGHAAGHQHAASVVWMISPTPEPVLLEVRGAR